MLVGLGFAMIAVFMYLILTKRWTPVVALILVPVVFGIIAVQLGVAIVPEDGVADTIMGAIESFAPTAALLFFAITYFGLMIDVGLFDPVIRFVLRVVGNSPVSGDGRHHPRTGDGSWTRSTPVNRATP